MADDAHPDLDRDVALAASAHQRLLAALDDLGDGLDVAAPSRLPGWSRGHVITHIDQSGRGHVRMFEFAAQGEEADQYPGGLARRAADIEAVADRPVREQVDALRRSIWDLEGCWARSEWRGHGTTPRGGRVAVADLPFLRTREVELHHVDLDIGYELDDLPSEYVRLELRRMEMSWRARKPMGMTPLPDAALAAAPARRLGWLTGRAEIDGLAPAGIF